MNGQPDFSKQWGGELEDGNGSCSYSINPDTVPPGYGIKECAVCKTQIIYGLLEIPGNLQEYRSFCPRCFFLERFTMPMPGKKPESKYINAPGFMLYLWEFCKGE